VKDFFGNGFTLYNDDGSSEHFSKDFFCGGFSGNKGTRIDKGFFGGFTVQKDGETERFTKDMFGGYSSDKGKRLVPDLIGGGCHITKNRGCMAAILFFLSSAAFISASVYTAAAYLYG
jgi:hypothetical protein